MYKRQAQKHTSNEKDFISESMVKINTEIEKEYRLKDSVWQQKNTYSLGKIYSSRDFFILRRWLYNEFRNGCESIEIFDYCTKKRWEPEVISHIYYNNKLIIYYSNIECETIYKVCDSCTADLSQIDQEKYFVVHSTVDKDGTVQVEFNPDISLIKE